MQRLWARSLDFGPEVPALRMRASIGSKRRNGRRGSGSRYRDGWDRSLCRSLALLADPIRPIVPPLAEPGALTPQGDTNRVVR